MIVSKRILVQCGKGCTPYHYPAEVDRDYLECPSCGSTPCTGSDLVAAVLDENDGDLGQWPKAVLNDGSRTPV
jgi:hypothetical protein